MRAVAPVEREVPSLNLIILLSKQLPDPLFGFNKHKHIVALWVEPVKRLR